MKQPVILSYSKGLCLLLCSCLSVLLSAQTPMPQVTRLFKLHPEVASLDTATKDQHYILQLNTQLLDSLCKTKPEEFILQLPASSLANQQLSLQLHSVKTRPSLLRVKTSGGIDTLVSAGLSYRGQVQGSTGGFGAACSLFEQEVMATFYDEQGKQWTLGRMGYDYPPDMYALYREESTASSPGFSCGAVPSSDYRVRPEPNRPNLRSAFNPVNKTVYVYFECEYDLYLAGGNVNNVVNYVVGIFNSVAMIYQSEGIRVEISELFVWTTPDPYSNNPSTALFAFRSNRPSFNGDLAHLITVKPGPSYAGIAFVSGFCSSYGYGYSQVASSYANYPNYSWSVNVVAHELGHNFGSPHTHDCFWNGNNTPLDGCGPVVGSVGEGCDPLLPPSPPFKGTLMSYCHAVGGIGIDFNLGFGQQPGDLVRASTEFASCLPCDSPRVSDLSITGITHSSAILHCSTLGVDGFDWRYRIVGAPTWVDLANTAIMSQLLNSLLAATPYEFQVSVRCTDGTWSEWSGGFNFMTLPNPTDSDMGGVSDVQELINGTNPNDAADDFQVAALQLKVLLQGALFNTNNGLMRDDLRAAALLPLIDPYHNSGNPRFAAQGSGASTITTAVVLATNVGTKDAIVDWIFIELRDSANASQVLETRAALVQRDGDVVDANDAVSALRFSGSLLNKRYFVSIKHRNHLGVMTAKAHLLHSSETLLLDFRTMPDSALYDKPGALNYNGAEMVQITVSGSGGDFAIGNNIKALWAGNSNGDHVIKYQGAANDVVPILQNVLSNTNNVLQVYNYGSALGYYGGDLNLNGNLKYQGSLNDVTFLLSPMVNFPLNLLGLYNYGAFAEQLP